MEPLSIALEKALLTLQDNVALVAPSLLPLVHKLGAEIRNERATSLEQKIQIVQKYIFCVGNRRICCILEKMASAPIQFFFAARVPKILY